MSSPSNPTTGGLLPSGSSPAAEVLRRRTLDPPPNFRDNANYGRILANIRARSKVCYADGREEKLAEKLTQLSEHKLGRYPMTPEQSLALRNEIGALEQSISPGGASISSYTPGEQAHLAQQAQAARDVAASAASPLGAAGVIGRDMGLNVAGVTGSVSLGNGQSLGFVSDGTSQGTQLTSSVDGNKKPGVQIGLVIARRGQTAADVVGGPGLTGQAGVFSGSVNGSGGTVGLAWPPGAGVGTSNTVIFPNQ